MKKAFTLAEVMIVLTVIGIISAIIMPIAMQSVPDKNVMLFKKGHNTLFRVISELVNSDKYYKDGDLGIKADGTRILGSFAHNVSGIVHSGDWVAADDSLVKYFCNTFADVVSTKSVNCSAAETGQNGILTFLALKASDSDTTSWRFTLDGAAAKLDEICKLNEVTSVVGAEIVTIDGITFYQTNPGGTFGVEWNANTTSSQRLFSTAVQFSLSHKPFCMDIDGIGKGEDPFGYGIRPDGKIINGKRAMEWLDKGLTDE